MLLDVHLQHRSRIDLVLQYRRCRQSRVGLPATLGDLLRLLCRTNWLCRLRRNVDTALEGPNDVVQSGMLWHWIVSKLFFDAGCLKLTVCSVVFQWSVSYMISPDAADLGVRAVFVWAGLLVPTVIVLYFSYPEVTRFDPIH